MIEITRTNDTLHWNPVPGAIGYVLHENGVRVSNSWDPTKKSWKVKPGTADYLLTAVTPLDTGTYPPAVVPAGTLVDMWKIVIQPRNHETGSDHYSFGWVKAKRNPAPDGKLGNEGRIVFADYPDGTWQVFGRMPTNTAVGRDANWHISPYPNGWVDEVSPYAWDWKPGSSWEGQSGHVAVLEDNPAPTHYSLDPTSTWGQGGMWWFITHTVWGRPGRARVWRINPKLESKLVLDVRKNTHWQRDSEVLFWNGAYINNSDKMTGPGTIGVTLDGIGRTPEEALADVAKFGSQELSRPDSGATGSTIVKQAQVLRPDAAILAAVR